MNSILIWWSALVPLFSTNVDGVQGIRVNRYDIRVIVTVAGLENLVVRRL